jgi:hypothetical protein
MVQSSVTSKQSRRRSAKDKDSTSTSNTSTSKSKLRKSSKKLNDKLQEKEAALYDDGREDDDSDYSDDEDLQDDREETERDVEEREQRRQQGGGSSHLGQKSKPSKSAKERSSKNNKYTEVSGESKIGTAERSEKALRTLHNKATKLLKVRAQLTAKKSTGCAATHRFTFSLTLILPHHRLSTVFFNFREVWRLHISSGDL